MASGDRDRVRAVYGVRDMDRVRGVNRVRDRDRHRTGGEHDIFF